MTSSRCPSMADDGEREAHAVAADDHGEGRAVVARSAVLLGRVHERHHTVGHHEHAAARDRPHGLVREAHGALDAVERDRERAPVGLHEQRGHDRQRQRQADLGRGALALHGRHRHFAAEAADRDPHGVHADAAAGDVGGDVGGGEARMEEQFGGARHVDRVDGFGADQPTLERLLGDARRVDAAAVVLDRDDDVAAGVPRGDLQPARLGLAGGAALVRPLEAVVERVADEVHERVAERVHDAAVQLGVLAHELQLDLLGQLDGEVAHEPREPQQHGLDRDHADLHDHRLQRVARAGQRLQRLREARDVGLGGEALDVRAVAGRAHPWRA